MTESPAQPSSPAPIERPRRIAGVDYGTVRVGIALGDTAQRIAGPYDTYQRRNARLDAEYFRRLAAEERIELFVVGLPVHLDGRESQKSREARAFGEWLHKETGVEVLYFDERFTTTEAAELLAPAGLTKKKRTARLDRVAAQVMLAAYLESESRAGDEPAPLDDI
jgi:putative Holliday junction resolvase